MRNWTRMLFARGKSVAHCLTALLSLLPVTGAWAVERAPDDQICRRTVKAEVVAIEQAYLLNRFSAFVPAGMLFALKRDVVPLDPALGAEAGPGNAMLRPDKRPRPLVLRVNEGECLEVTFTNLLAPTAGEEGGVPVQNGGRLPAAAQATPGSAPRPGVVRGEPVSVDRPRTRAASFHITGLGIVPIRQEDCPAGAACGGDGSNVGLPENQGMVYGAGVTAADFPHGSLAMPGQTVVTKWRATADGAYFAYSMGAPVGGEGDGGQIGLGLFAAVNVEPAGSRWYRSQVTHAELQEVAKAPGPGGHPYDNIQYDDAVGGVPVLNLLDGQDNIVHSDLNAIIVPPPPAAADTCKGRAYGTRCGEPFREFTVIFHDEVHAEQAFARLDDENDPLHLIKDGMGINYGVSGMGSLMMATKQFGKNVGPAKDCAECRAEEFFLSSWANGDPALLLRYGADGKAAGALYPDDPSNVHHSYMGDNVRFRNLHAGPKETHVFHLHAHQWVPDPKDPNASYLDSQTISPGATFSYDIEFGGSGNRNYTPGDSIFHCHLYPHFAQGMWELWRSHDAFADGRPGLYDPSRPDDPETNDPGMMNLPDGEIAGGTETPALVPIPGSALAPMPTKAFRGYPFYIPGRPGHRPPQPVLDFDVDQPWTNLSVAPPEGSVIDGGLPRHVVVAGENPQSEEAVARALRTGGEAAQLIAARVKAQDPASVELLARDWTDLDLRVLREDGEPAEKLAMQFHEGTLATSGLSPVPAAAPNPAWWQPKAYRTDRAAPLSGSPTPTDPPLFYVNGRPRAQGAPYAEPCPEDAPVRDYRAAFIQTELTYNKHGWFDPQGRIVILENDIKDIIDPDRRTGLPAPLFFRANSGECINFKSSNFVPAALNADDFQVYTPTDTIGQHIHLVKFDVTSSDGSGNGWNYEDATFSPQEVRDRILAYNAHLDAIRSPAKRLAPKAHPLFLPGGDIFEAAAADPERYGRLLERGQCPPQGSLSPHDYARLLDEKHDLCGAQRTTQRWWADPILNTSNNKDATLRTVFTHDHMGPSSHQQHGLYAALVIEPANSVWSRIGATLDAADMAAAGRMTCNNRFTDPADPRGLCDRLIGGSDIAAPTAPALKAGAGSILSVVEPRKPLKLRDDGGPTSTMANIFAPRCIGDSDSYEEGLQPSSGWNKGGGGHPCDAGKLTHDTRREFDLAIADFGIAYNTALEPINPEPFGDNGLRDKSSIRFGTRHVFATPARPLAISSEDPGSQYFNYRHEPVALRISDGTPDAVHGGWTYAQSQRRAGLLLPCTPGDQDCLGDPANAFSTAVHARSDQALATTPQPTFVTPAVQTLYRKLDMEPRLFNVLAKVEAWRRNFNCALYSEALVPTAGNCAPGIVRAEPWRQFGDPATPILPAYEGDPVQIRLIQGAQEAQHIFTMNGVKWHRLPGAGLGAGGNNSGFVSAQPIGISEHFEFDVRTPGPRSPVTDYLYFASSVDQLWDGAWGVLRTYQPPDPDRPTELSTSAAPALTVDPAPFLAAIPGRAESEVGGDLDDPCRHSAPGATDVSGRVFKVAVMQVRDLDPVLANKGPIGLVYNKRLGLSDPDALAYLLEDAPQTCASMADCQELTEASPTNEDVRRKLRKDYSAETLRPLVLHAAAGECVFVRLRNLLPARIDDGPRDLADAPRARMEARASYNFLPMITDGFNINDFRMSSSVGISPTGVALTPRFSDGSNVGLNSAVATMSQDQKPNAHPFDGPPSQLRRQGSLLPPCVGDKAVDGEHESRCKDTFTWSLTDFTRSGEAFNQPLELGAVPLRSFGDSLKHAGHGLVGALVIGPVGSRICPDDARFPLTKGEGPSVEICRRGGWRYPDGSRYVDHTVIMQDSVFTSWNGLPADNLSGAEEPDDYGAKALNYKTEPLWARTGGDPSARFPERNEQDMADMLSSATLGTDATPRCVSGIAPLQGPSPCDPETPVFQANAGEEVRMHFVHPGGHTRQQGLAISGHAWNPHPWDKDSLVLDPAAGSSIRQGVFNGFGPMMATTMAMTAGGDGKAPLDYLFRGQGSFLFDGGQWGILRVAPATDGEARR